jgi:NitT/TauT family transport system substrate-binding protein
VKRPVSSTNRIGEAKPRRIRALRLRSGQAPQGDRIHAREHRTSRREALWIGAAALVAATTRPAGAQNQTLRIATTGAEAFAEPIYADDLGFFKKVGVTVTIDRYSGGEPTIAAVASGHADLGITTPIQLADAVVHGVSARLVGWCGQYSSQEAQPAIYVTKDSPLHTAQDLIGKTIGVNALGTMNFLGVEAWLSKNGVSVSQVHPIEVPFAAMAAALERGTIDAAVLAEPFITDAGDSLRLLAKAFDVMGPHWTVSVWMSSIALIESQPALIRRAMDAAYATAKYVNAHPDAANPIIAKFSKIPPATIAAMRHTHFAEAPDPESARTELAYAYQFKLLPKPVTVEQLMSTS